MSNLDKSAAGKLIFSCGDNLVLYLPYNGFAAAKIEVLAFNVVVIPALEMEMVCCSITSWIAVRSVSSILSNSSIQQIPLSANTSAPPSKIISSVTGSLKTAAVKPTPDEPLPVVYTDLGAILLIAFNNCDLATPGSPIRHTLISPLIFNPSPISLVTPPHNKSNKIFLISKWP